ncbi:MAG: hypothetical protein IIB74_09705 [Proteobacteria bacterium]|nr:hypothetical protein [Pseudomonadota bacterium]
MSSTISSKMPSNVVIRIGMLRNLTVCSRLAWRLRGFLHGLVSATHGAAQMRLAETKKVEANE